MLKTDVTTHYFVLGVSEDASPAQIKAAYRRLARRCHPDMVGSKDSAKLDAAEKQFKRINYAHDILSNPEARREYDRTYSPHQYIFTESPSYTEADSSEMQPLYCLTSFDEKRLQDAWDEFISKPFEWSEKSLRFLQKWEWVLGIAAVVAACLFFTGQFTTIDIFEFLLTTSAAPGVESGIPANVMAIGTNVALAFTIIVALWAIVTHRYSFRRSELFRRQLLKLSCNLFIVSAVVFSVAGLVIGHYLF